MADSKQKGSYNWYIELNCGVDVSTVTTKTFKIVTPGGTTVTRTPDFKTDGTDFILRYKVVSADVAELSTELGTYSYQAVLAFPDAGYNGPTPKGATYDILSNYY